MVPAISNTWIGVVGALGGVALTGLIALVTAVLNHRWQAETQRQERQSEGRAALAGLRRAAYTRYLTASKEAVAYAVTRPKDLTASAEERLRRLRLEDPRPIAESDAAELEARLVAGDRVTKAIDVYDAQLAATIAAVTASIDDEIGFGPLSDDQRALVEAMRTEVHELQEPG